MKPRARRPISLPLRPTSPLDQSTPIPHQQRRDQRPRSATVRRAGAALNGAALAAPLLLAREGGADVHTD
ncbi:hypothetical protein ACFVX9_27075, partial [Kitasatospora sp. NPDC058243]|uniref:hypothetical protein n=1 Tax=Kitasatospora sp. NPDC058243 TaxID=3346397 RepID=UPI0036D7922C